MSENGLAVELEGQNLAGDASEVDPDVLTDLIAGEDPFMSWGYCELKITQGKSVRHVKVPIKAIGVSDVMERVAKDAPVAPRMIKAIKKDSEEGRALGLKHDKIVEMENQRDPQFMKDMQDYNVLSTWRVVLKGLAMNIRSKDDPNKFLVKANTERSATEVLDEKGAIEALKMAGWSTQHITQLYQAISRLTSDEAERVDRE